ncbi:MAG: hypothetical protein SW833_14970 [Cyanobacteriota bacterium]|nr:hypothetical protein [Cyanobacteriota bacterium]
MTTEESLVIEVVNSTSEHFESINKLGDANSKTIGFFPRGAFERLVGKGFI